MFPNDILCMLNYCMQLLVGSSGRKTFALARSISFLMLPRRSQERMNSIDWVPLKILLLDKKDNIWARMRHYVSIGMVLCSSKNVCYEGKEIKNL